MNLTKCAVPAGTTIHKEKPFVHILSSKFRTERCENCLKKAEVLKCSKCQYSHYCNRDCQKSAWTLHKKECPKLKRIQPRILPDAVRFLSRILLKLNMGGDMDKGYYTSTKFRKFKDLMSHYPDIKKNDKRMEHFTSMCGVLFEYLGDEFMPNSVELIGIYGRMVVNGFCILDPEMVAIGTGIYLGASVIDHSCDPNAVAVFEGTTLLIRTLKNLDSLDWTKIFISYVELLNNTAERREDLQKTYFFFCECPKCLDSSPELKFCAAAACPNEKCTFPLNLYADTDKCVKCGEIVTTDFRRNFESAVEFSKNQLVAMKDLTYLDVCKHCLNKHKGVLHPLNLVHLKMLDLAFESCIEMNQWEEARKFGRELLPGFELYCGSIHPILGVLYLKMGKICLYLEIMAESRENLKKAANILKITHGEAHSLYMESVRPLLAEAFGHPYSNGY